MGRWGVRELGDDAHFLVMVGDKCLDQEANAIGSGRCLSVPAQVPGTFGVLDLGCILLWQHCGRFSFVNNRAVINLDLQK